MNASERTKIRGPEGNEIHILHSWTHFMIFMAFMVTSPGRHGSLPGRIES